MIAVAEARFLESGYAATSMSGIAAELGGSKGTLWSYFPSKDALFAAVLDTMIDRFSGALDEALLPVGDTATILDRFGLVFIRRITSKPSLSLLRLLIAEAERVPQLGVTFYERGSGQVATRLAKFIEGEIAAGSLIPCDPLIAARHFMALCQIHPFHLLLAAPTGLSEAAMSEDVKAAVACFLRAYGSARPDTD